MPANRVRSLVRSALTPFALPPDDRPDGELLARFLAARDEAAFEALVRRHGPMVLAVCRAILRDPADADDAFQATFLVLVRRAAAIRDRAAVGGWLYAVAGRVARRLRAPPAATPPLPEDLPDRTTGIPEVTLRPSGDPRRGGRPTARGVPAGGAGVLRRRADDGRGGDPSRLGEGDGPDAAGVGATAAPLPSRGPGGRTSGRGVRDRVGSARGLRGRSGTLDEHDPPPPWPSRPASQFREWCRNER